MSAVDSVPRARCRLVERLRAELNALDAELFEPFGLIAKNLGQHPLGFMPAREELDHLLDLGANDSQTTMPKPCGGQPSRLLAESCVSVRPSK